jgi:hypothetical protein
MKKIYLLTLTLLVVSNSFAQTVWTGGGDGYSWTDINNWDGVSFPLAGDNVEFVDGPWTISGGSCNDMTFSGTADVTFDTDLTIFGTLNIVDFTSFNTTNTVVVTLSNAGVTHNLNGGAFILGYDAYANISGNLFIAATATVEVNAGGGILVGGNLTKFGTINLYGGDTGSLAGTSLKVDGTVTNSGGTCTYNQFLIGSGGGTPDGRRYYISSPFSDATSGTFSASGDNKLFSYAESTLSYTEITTDVVTLNPTKGYVVRTGFDATHTASSSNFFNNSDISTSGLTYTGAAANTGYNLIGNPYSTFYDWESATLTSVSSTYTIKTVSGGTVPVNDTYNGTSHIGTNNSGTGALTKYIAPFQGFWIQASAPGAQVDFFKTGRTILINTILRSTESSLIRLNLTNGITSDQLVVNFNADAGENFDAFDSEKMFLNTVPEIYAQVEDKQLVINTLPVVTENTIVPLTLTIPTDGAFDFKLEEISGLFNDFNVFIVDKLNETVNMVNENEMYHFASVAGLSSGRFDLVFSNSLSAGIHTAEIQKISMYNVNSTVHVNLNGLEKGEANVYDVAGRKVGAYNLDNNTNQFELQEGAGVYTVEVLSGSNRKTQKIVIQ